MGTTSPPVCSLIRSAERIRTLPWEGRVFLLRPARASQGYHLLRVVRRKIRGEITTRRLT